GVAGRHESVASDAACRLMRAFVAVDLDDRAREAVAAEQRRLRALLDPGSLRWVGVAHLHLTLVFLADVPVAQRPALVAAFERPVAQRRFDLTRGGSGVFPPRGAPRALWIGVSAGGSELTTLHDEVVRRVRVLGARLESRPFNAHLTLARWKT